MLLCRECREKVGSVTYRTALGASSVPSVSIETGFVGTQGGKGGGGRELLNKAVLSSDLVWKLIVSKLLTVGCVSVVNSRGFFLSNVSEVDFFKVLLWTSFRVQVL